MTTPKTKKVATGKAKGGKVSPPVSVPQVKHPSPLMREFFASDATGKPWFAKALKEEYPLPAMPRFSASGKDALKEKVCLGEAGIAEISMEMLSVARPYAFLVAANNVSGFNARDDARFSEQIAPLVEVFKTFSDAGTRIIVDSGVFELAATVAREEEIHILQAIVRPPSAYPTYQRFLHKYVRLMQAIAPHLWGFVEIDLGTFQQRRETRARLLDDYGLLPMPVFRAGVDDWEDLVTLCEEQHPLICLAGTAHCPRKYANVFWAKAWTILRDYPDTKAHVLGVSWRGAFLPYGFASSDNASFAATNMNGSTSARGLTGSSANLWPTYTIGGAAVYEPGVITAFNNMQAMAQTIRAGQMLLYSKANYAFGLTPYPWGLP